MLQRIQTLYLTLAAGCAGGLHFLFPLWTPTSGMTFYAQDDMVYLALFFTSALLSLIAIIKSSLLNGSGLAIGIQLLEEWILKERHIERL